MAGLLARVLAALLLGFGFGQSAELAQQYLQRLGGAADELRAVVARFDEDAAAEGVSRAEALRRLAGNSDRIALRQGEAAAFAIRRFEAVSRRYDALRATAPLFRPFAMALDPDGAILRRAAGDFRPALPLGTEGILLTFLGFAFGWMLGSGGTGLAQGIATRRRRRRAALPPPPPP